jgi:hypothetical protein
VRADWTGAGAGTCLLELLHERGFRFVVIGGVAVATHGYVRGTEDLALD